MPEPLSTGDAAPDFRLPGSAGTSIENYRLREFTETGVGILLFYPFDFSSICTAELCSFRDAEWLLVTEGVDVLGISTDSAYSHREFVDKYDLPFPLLSDSGGEAAAQYGVLQNELEGHTQVCKRAIMIVDSSDTVRYRWIADDPQENFDTDIITEAADALDTIPTPGWNDGSQ